jgi:predicted nucleic acid-binding protein
VRAGRVGRDQQPPVRRLLERLWEAIVPIEIDEELVARAGDLAEDHALRGFDAVHLASAESVADDETFVASADTDLLSAARERGLAIFDVPR